MNEKKAYTGESVNYYETGEIKSQLNYIEGKATGESIVYYKSGQISSKINYKEGKKTGKSFFIMKQDKYYSLRFKKTKNNQKRG